MNHLLSKVKFLGIQLSHKFPVIIFKSNIKIIAKNTSLKENTLFMNQTIQKLVPFDKRVMNKMRENFVTSHVNY